MADFEDLPYNDNDLNEETLFIVKYLNPYLIYKNSNFAFIIKKECSVNEITEELFLGQSRVSHQLRFLKNLGLVKYRRAGTTLYYSHDDEHVMNILEQTIDHARHH
ncbi:ArsR/SmtB family transcription factor [Peribacillus tepidiphilus]|jgi:ArsR family transcriptional regulator, zinc-responsive transcriptional repressor|uniref:ArsR/SmtB family transcription factor n=1 Tax=Peribacillus tepidiphilus TaxID=2652445 RepID=UPI0012922937|nr:metalloregulator ArsR/SmtB family transcription factor [Peribacillus tepidiphilus]